MAFTFRTVLLTALCGMLSHGLMAALPGQPFASYWHPATLLNWNPATDPDAPFNRASVPLASRFLNGALNVNPHARTNEAKVASLVAFASTSGNPSQGSLSISYYACNYWHYMDTLVFWGGSAGEGIILAPNSTVIDAAHRNGVAVLGNVFFPPAVYGGQLQWVRDFVQRNGSSFPVADKLIQVATRYGFDGWFINQETSGGDATLAADMRDCLRYIETNSNLRVMWYDAMTESGPVSWQDALNANNDWFLQYNGARVSDTMFLDFGWSGAKMTSSRSHAQSLGRDPYDLFAGVDVEGNGYNTSLTWTNLFPEGQPHRLSVGFYRPEWTQKYSSGVTDFYARDNFFWVGPNGDPSDTTTTNSWKGMAHYIPALSPIRQLPFFTHFNTGHGSRYAINGATLSVRDWNNLSVQDVLPTWRWLQRTTGTRLLAEFSSSECFYGGASLKFSGTLDATNDLQLFQTSLPITNNTNLRIAFKNGTSGAATRTRVSLSFEDAPSTFVFLDLGATTNANWNLRQFSLGSHVGRRLATIGLRCEASGTVSNFVIRIGEIAVFDGAISTPSPPAGLVVEQFNRVDTNTATLRLHWTHSPTAVQTYNVYRRNPDNSLTFLGSTPNNAYFVPELKRFGSEAGAVIELEAVSPDYGHSARIAASIVWDTNTVVYIPTRSAWKYMDGGANLGAAWRALNYSDGPWPSGMAQLGFGDGDEGTVVASNRQVTTYFRQPFLPAPGTTNLIVRLLRDDGAVVYLNDTEVFRSNMPNGPIDYLTLATNASTPDETTNFYSANVSSALLVPGTNVLAVEVHQGAANSSDLSFALELSGQFSAATPLLTVTNLSPAGITYTTAQLRGDMTSLSGPATITIFYGLIDGGTTASAWGNQLVVGERSPGMFTALATNLFPGTNYYFRCHVANGSGSAWASASASFSTPAAVTAALVAEGSVWRYLDNGSDQGTAWRTIAFNDSGWKSGAAELGYGDDNETTVVEDNPTAGYNSADTNRYITTYFRRKFFSGDPTRILSLVARLLRDDGAVVYLNGVEAWRDNLPAGSVGYQTVASAAISGSAETTYLSKAINPALLVVGTNVVAVEMHQNTNTSTDISFDFGLLAAVDVPGDTALSASRAGAGSILLSGPANAAYLRLYGATNLTSPISWTPFTNPPYFSNGQWSVTIPLSTNGERFFRLQGQ